MSMRESHGQKEIGSLLAFLEGFNNGQITMNKVIRCYKDAFKELREFMIHYIDVLGELDNWRDSYKKLVNASQNILQGKP